MVTMKKSTRITNQNNREHNEKWLYIPDFPYRILIIGDSGSGKSNTSLNLIKEEDNDNFIDKIYWYAKDLSERKYEFFIKKRENAGIKHLNDSNAFIECSYTMVNVYENINKYNPSRKIKICYLFICVFVFCFWLQTLWVTKHFKP